MKAPTADIYQAEDGAWVVHIDTDPEGECTELGPRPLRVYINDGEPVYQNPVRQNPMRERSAPLGIVHVDNCPTCGGSRYDYPTDCPDEAHNYGVVKS